ncbi:MAG: hypothetical protein N3D82_03020 [Ignisphaera sp.]|nr:hypothetical protein [Ignisphaera sp.]MCX8167988.1 hypothetical protein [Ignisphaera sp.]MDW8086000.1 hypothetical protein [Ignisphaera sp.]
MSKLLSTIAILYREKLYEYNSTIKNTGYYLKPFHITTKKWRGGVKVYHYYGRYWYRLTLQGSKLKWCYIGSRKPHEGLPDPPINPLLLIRISDSDGKNCLCVLGYRTSDSEAALEYLEKALLLLEIDGDSSKVLPNSLRDLLHRE